MTDEGFAEVASALVESLKYDGNQGRVVRLEELCLINNRLTATSLQALSPIIRLATNDLRDLDLSENNIAINSDAEVAIWEDFLTSFRDCCVLRRVDFSRNALGPRAFEVMTRVYAKQEAVDMVLPADLEQVQRKERRTCADVAGLGRKLRKMSVVSDPDDWGSDKDNDPKSDGHKDSRHGLLAASCFTELVDSLFRFEITRKSCSFILPARIATHVCYYSGTQISPVYCAIQQRYDRSRCIAPLLPT